MLSAKVICLAFVAMFAVQSAAASPLSMGPVQNLNGQKPASQIGQPLLKGEECGFCVNAMGQILNQLINILLNAGVLGSCGDLCGMLPNKYEALACNLLCDYVGIEGFIDAIQYEDPDPIFICEKIGFCTPVEGGEANITSVTCVPPKVAQGDTVNIDIEWTVTKATGPGGLNAVILPPLGFPISGGSFIDGQKPGAYRARFSLKTQPTEMDPMQPGTYRVEVALCEGDCSHNHAWGGIYSQAKSSFVLTGGQQ